MGYDDRYGAPPPTLAPSRKPLTPQQLAQRVPEAMPVKPLVYAIKRALRVPVVGIVRYPIPKSTAWAYRFERLG